MITNEEYEYLKARNKHVLNDDEKALIRECISDSPDLQLIEALLKAGTSPNLFYRRNIWDSSIIFSIEEGPNIMPSLHPEYLLHGIVEDYSWDQNFDEKRDEVFLSIVQLLLSYGAIADTEFYCSYPLDELGYAYYRKTALDVARLLLLHGANPLHITHGEVETTYAYTNGHDEPFEAMDYINKLLDLFNKYCCLSVEEIEEEIDIRFSQDKSRCNIICREPIKEVYYGISEYGTDEGHFIRYDSSTVQLYLNDFTRLILKTDSFMISIGALGIKRELIEDFNEREGEYLQNTYDDSDRDDAPWIQAEHTLFVGEHLNKINCEDGYYSLEFDYFNINVHSGITDEILSWEPDCLDYHLRIYGFDHLLTRKCDCGGAPRIVTDFTNDYIACCEKCGKATWAAMNVWIAIEDWNDNELGFTFDKKTLESIFSKDNE